MFFEQCWFQDDGNCKAKVRLNLAKQIDPSAGIGSDKPAKRLRGANLSRECAESASGGQ